MKEKVNVARLSVFSNSFLIIMKLSVGLVSGSVSIISEAIHSAMDLVAAIIAFFAVRISDNPPDSRHPYGHGKYENISGVVEAMLILVAAFWIIWEAVNKIVGGEGELEAVWLGIIVMAVSAGLNFFVSKKLYKVAHETNSVALEADALHLMTDVYTSAGVALGLVLILLTGLTWLDPVVAILVAMLILRESWHLLRKAFTPLIDTAWADKEIHVLRKKLDSMNVSYHDLRTRVAGNYRFIDIHIEVPGKESVGDAHKYCDMIEEELMKDYQNLTVTIHVEPVGTTSTGSHAS